MGCNYKLKTTNSKLKKVFRFKQFAIDDTGATMKVGTDAVLLGALAHCAGAANILDIGTGCGVVALIMAQRSANAAIHAVEPDTCSADCARKNFEVSPWSDRLAVFETTAQQFARTAERRYDCIVCNPPYFERSLKSPLEIRNKARHNDNLPFDELAGCVARLLANNGTFTAILPCAEAAHFISTAKEKDLFCKSKKLIYSKLSNNPLRTVFAMGREEYDTPQVSQVAIYNGDGQYSGQYRELTRDLYLWGEK